MPQLQLVRRVGTHYGGPRRHALALLPVAHQGVPALPRPGPFPPTIGSRLMDIGCVILTFNSEGQESTL